MKTNEAKQLLETLCQHGIPLTLSVPFLIRAQGLRVQELAQRAGCHRSVLRMTLEGRRNAPVRLREELRRQLGCDPWEIAATETPVQAGKNRVRADHSGVRA